MMQICINWANLEIGTALSHDGMVESRSSLGLIYSQRLGTLPIDDEGQIRAPSEESLWDFIRAIEYAKAKIIIDFRIKRFSLNAKKDILGNLFTYATTARTRNISASARLRFLDTKVSSTSSLKILMDGFKRGDQIGILERGYFRSAASEAGTGRGAATRRLSYALTAFALDFVFAALLGLLSSSPRSK